MFGVRRLMFGGLGECENNPALLIKGN